MTTCRLTGCTSPGVTLPEKYAHLGVPLCNDHLAVLSLRVDSALGDAIDGVDMEDIVVLREAQSLLFDPAPRLVGLVGGGNAR